MAEKEVKFHDVIDPDTTLKADVATAVAQHADSYETYIISVGGQIHVIGVEP